MTDKLTMFQSITAGDRQPISSGDRKTPNARSSMHVAPKQPAKGSACEQFVTALIQKVALITVELWCS